ncbi:MAG: zinc-ribbon domain-containing protein [Coriobacteriales bacterium]|jgi:hypothetical protein|nr:zinc-ribbon domain-containing protein [Coriobacteriales bacterium]
MQCTSCGAQVFDNATFCTVCGSPMAPVPDAGDTDSSSVYQTPMTPDVSASSSQTAYSASPAQYGASTGAYPQPVATSPVYQQPVPAQPVASPVGYPQPPYQQSPAPQQAYQAVPMAPYGAYPPPYGNQQAVTNMGKVNIMGIVSLSCAVLSMLLFGACATILSTTSSNAAAMMAFFAMLLVVPAIVFGAVSLGKSQQNKKLRGLGIAGLVLGILFAVIYLFIMIVGIMVYASSPYYFRY